jgi:PKD domain
MPVRLARYLVGAVLLCAASWPSAAFAQNPELTINSPSNGASTNNRTLTFRGITSTPFDEGSVTPVKLNIHRVPIVEGEKPLELVAEQGQLDTGWTATVSSPGLADGTYVAQAEQTLLESKQTVKSAAVTFTVDTEAPIVTITSPPSGSSAIGESQTISGTAGTAPGDVPFVTIEVFAGASIPLAPAGPVATAFVGTSAGTWSEVFALPPGTYTVRATQRDEAQNLGTSAEPRTFTLAGAPQSSPASPEASFTWLPAAPVAGEGVALVSNSTDPLGIASYAWDLAGNGPFTAAGPVLTTSFATPGSHTVRLRVIDALGAQNIAKATIHVSPAALKLMQPFPIVRIGGVESGGGVRISTLGVLAPVGVRVTVTCTGRGCKLKPQSAAASATAHNRHGNAVTLSFPRFQRFLPAGVTLEVRVLAAGEIGKYTRFVIRRHGVPSRTDACLAGVDPKPIACPA